MFKLVASNIHLNQTAENKEIAINDIATSLIEAGLVEPGYGAGMLERERQASTYLGNGIAIPHGTTTTRHLVLKTGVSVFHYPNGVTWGDDGEKAYVAIGIAAKSDEHLTLLKQLTHVLSEEGVETRLKHIETKEDLIAILTGKDEHNNDMSWDPELFLFDAAADNLSTLRTVNSTSLKGAGAISDDFIATINRRKPYYLGQGIWLDDSPNGNLKNAIAVSKPQSSLTEEGSPVKMLITAATVGETLTPTIEALANILFIKQGETLLSYSQTSLIEFFQHGLRSSEIPESEIPAQRDGMSEEFILQNPHGLHTRPGSMLVKVVKNYDANVTVVNMSSDPAKSVNAASLMKLVALGAKKGDKLKFTAVGAEAKEVLDAIGNAIEAGLGEGNE